MPKRIEAEAMNKIVVFTQKTLREAGCADPLFIVIALDNGSSASMVSNLTTPAQILQLIGSVSDSMLKGEGHGGVRSVNTNNPLE